MANGGKLSIFQPILQYGFAGFSMLLLAVVCWQIDKTDTYMESMMSVQGETNQVIERNTAAIRELSRVVHDKL